MADLQPEQVAQALRNKAPQQGLTDQREVSKLLLPNRQILLMRHGATKLNNDDVSVDRIRGWKDVPLSEDGEEEARVTAHKIKKSGDLPDAMAASDLKRAADTGKIISGIIGVPLSETTKVLRPWDVGNLAGVVSKEAIPVLADYAQNKPKETIPGGESFDDFRGRFLGGLNDLLTKYLGTLGIVTHHRGERLLKAWQAAGFPQNGDIDIKVFNQKGEHTGSAEPMDIPLGALKKVD